MEAEKRKKHLQTLRSEFVDLGHGDAFDIAARLHIDWKKNYPKGFWGRTIEVEYQLPRNEKEAALLEVFYGCEFTLRPDWVTFIDEACAENIARCVPELGRMEPGYYLHDYKTAGRRMSDPTTHYNQDMQMRGYLATYNKLHDIAAKGMLVHRVISTKETAFQHTLVEWKERFTDSTKEFLESAAMLAPTKMKLGLAANCNFYNKPCPHLITGACNG